jgi:hypothetical protein
VRLALAGGEACVRTRCWGPRRAGARFCFRGSCAMPLWPAAGARFCFRGRCFWYDVASLSCHPCFFAVSLAVMSANLWPLARGRRGCARRTPANDRGAHAAHALDLGLHGRGYHTGEYLHVDGGRGGVPVLNCLGHAALCPRGPVQVSSGGVPAHAEGDGLHLDKHARPPGLP